MLKFFGYDKCSTCRRARQWLDSRGVDYEAIDITKRPPSRATLRAILKSGDYTLMDLFNKSGELYRSMKMKDRLATLTEAEALALLAEHGRLCKRPIVTDGERFTVGFDEERYRQDWG